MEGYIDCTDVLRRLQSLAKVDRNSPFFIGDEPSVVCLRGSTVRRVTTGDDFMIIGRGKLTKINQSTPVKSI